MNNEQFRKLIESNPSRTHGASPTATAGTRSNGFSMAPRTVKGTARGNARHYKSSAPKGVKLAKGYQDRTKDRQDDQNEKAYRIAALEESMKKEEIDEATFLRLRDEITGGEVENTHLVKGLDWKLLERIRRGEQIDSAGEDVDNEDNEFEELEKVQVQAAAKESTQKIGQQAPARKTRDQILAELKASRKRAAPEIQLGSKFRKIGESRAEETGRRGVRDVKHKFHKSPEPEVPTVLLDAEVHVPKQKTPEPSDDDGDIYADIGDDYDPLADLGESDDSGEEGEKEALKQPEGGRTNEQKPSSGARRNYFDDDPLAHSVLKAGPDPTFMAAMVAATKKASETAISPDEERLKKRAAMLAQDRDLDDMDMGFGSNRMDDEEDEAEGADGGDHKKKRTRKRKGEKKGDKNSVADVMAVIEGRK